MSWYCNWTMERCGRNIGGASDLANHNRGGDDDAGHGLGNLAVTQEYVNEAVANRAIDATVVHLAGQRRSRDEAVYGASGASRAGGRERRCKQGYVIRGGNVGPGRMLPSRVER